MQQELGQPPVVPQDTTVSGASKPGWKGDPAFNALEWRLVGPFRGGRVVAVAGDPVNKQVFYFGSTGGGVWKTDDGGTYWRNVSDGSFKRASVGALAVAPSDPNVIYAGMGEATIRGNVSHGDGVYKSTDAGKTWVHVGLEDTRNIAKVRVHPKNPDVVYVAALGHAHGPNEQRGVFRSTDGGKTWQRVLFRNDQTGASDLALDPANPRILYAALWQARRGPHALVSGGEGTSFYKSSDGGDTWTDITRAKGLPEGTLGKIGVAVSPARSGRVWAIVDGLDKEGNDAGAVYRSDDGGATWQKLSAEGDIRGRPWYYMHIIADPKDAETVWVLNVRLFRSSDGGRTFDLLPVPHGDNHDLWIDPDDPRRMIEGNDGGATVTFNGADTWSTIYNQPTAEFYHVTTDTRTPYRILGAQQDNSTISGPSRSPLGAIPNSEFYEIGGGEAGYIQARPDNPDIIFAGNYLGYITRYDHRTSQYRDITVWPENTLGAPAKEARYRFQWTYPIVISPHDPNVLYVTGNHVFRSTDEGASWEAISPDLTRHDPATLEDSGGPVTKDNVGTEYYATIFAFDESKVQRGVFWAGSDDGLVHVSRDGGQTWENVTPPDLPEWALISIIEPSPHDAATAYVAANRYKHDDFRPYLYKTNDYGKTWTAITAGIPADEFMRAIREDPERRGLLLAGTEAGIYVSFDDGARWESLRLNLPIVPIHDLVIKDSDVIVATHGRSFWVLDDITSLRQLTGEVREQPAHLFAPRPTVKFATAGGFSDPARPGKNYRYSGAFIVAYTQREKPTGATEDIFLDAGKNPPDGVMIAYYLREKPEGEVTLTFRDEGGNVIKRFSSEEKKDEKKPAATAGAKPDEPKKKEKKEPRLPKEAGSNRFIWNMRYPDPVEVEGYVSSEDNMTGPAAAPGRYTAELRVGDQSLTREFDIRKDPRIAATDDELREQFAFLIQIRDRFSETEEAINTIRELRRQLTDWERRADGYPQQQAVADAAKPITEQLTAIEEELIQVKAKNRSDTLDHPIKLNAKLAYLIGVVASTDAAPTRQARDVFADLSARVETQLTRLRALRDGPIAAFNARLRELDVAAVRPLAKREEKREEAAQP